MKKFTLYTDVKVVKLVQSADRYDGWPLNKRPPQIGDIGTLIDFLGSKRKPAYYIVEKSDPADGIDIWLCDFLEEEIEPLPVTKKKKSFIDILKSIIPRRHIVVTKVRITDSKW
jgi:hypothetical protein